MPQYLSPGVYVEEVPSAVKSIAGVSTSTAGFIGISPGTAVPGDRVINEAVGAGTGSKKNYRLARTPVDPNGAEVRVNNLPITTGFTITNESDFSQIKFDTAPESGATITASYTPVFEPVEAGVAKLCTNFTEYKKFFGDFSTDIGQTYLTHAVYGFFNNGGSRCYVVRINPIANSKNPPEGKATELAAALESFEAIDEIAIVAAPGITDANARDKIVTHCSQRTKDRFAILDSPEIVETGGALDLTLLDPKNAKTVMPNNSDYAAFYFPWIQVFDPATKAAELDGDGLIYVPPSGHIAGVYARVDTERGVHKAPANETLLGALGLRYNLSKSQQDGLNPQGVNCIRSMNGNIRVWGARTIGGDANADLKYVNVRRTLLFLRESIDEGTQWVVFEPNTPALWQQISRNVTAFLTNVWRSGALFGNTAAEAFYVKCDAETNPPELRELGQVVTEIGVSIVRPAEFVIFRISQFTAPGS
ncbi:MAG TPA: phage tail sheath subtilisin-like domain-containing protein [Pyrinomonadaceae bacterium]|nr:phage tail sheath subtilisin-like domain-containing protein [Pyrinomonadaceae bacterium]